MLGACLSLVATDGAAIGAEEAGLPSVVSAVVLRVIDGSSLDAHVEGRRTAVGYLGALAPPANQPCGERALARNRELVGQSVLLQDDPAYQFDERGGSLFYAFTTDGVFVDAALVSEGLGRAVRPDGQYGAYLAAVEAEAAAERRGCVWGG